MTFILCIAENKENMIGPDKASLVVDICKQSTCDASIIPEFCADSIQDRVFCKIAKICNCETLLAYSFMPGVKKLSVMKVTKFLLMASAAKLVVARTPYQMRIKPDKVWSLVLN